MPTPAATTSFDLAALHPDELAALLAQLSAAGHVPPATPDGHPGTHIVPGQRIKVRDLVDTALDGVGPNSARTFRTYLNDLANGVTVPRKGNTPKVEFAGLGDRWLDEVKFSDLEKAVKAIRARAVRSAEARADVRESLGRAAHESVGDGAVYNAVGAFRRLFMVGVENRHLAPGMEPTRKLKSPKQARSERRALTRRELDEVWEVITGTGDDPLLDEMIARTIVISGARREGILNLRMRGLDDVECTIRLDEKFAACVRRREITTNPDPALLIPAGVGSPPSLLPSRAGRCTL